MSQAASAQVREILVLARRLVKATHDQSNDGVVARVPIWRGSNMLDIPIMLPLLLAWFRILTRDVTGVYCEDEHGLLHRG